MEPLGLVITTLGALLLLGLCGDLLSRWTPLPRVTLLVLFGILVGPPGLSLLPVEAKEWYPFISNIALLIIGFLLGGKLSLANLREVGRHVLGISLFEVMGASLCVLGGLLLIGTPTVLALILAGIAPASAPAAVNNVVEELRAKGKYTNTLLGVVAIDDAWGLIVFSLLLALAQALAPGADGTPLSALLHGGRELGGALLVGLLVGGPAAYLTGRLRPGEPTQAEALGVVLLAGGIALWLEVSFLLTAMVVGAAVTNLATHHERPFHEIEHIEWPFMILFFLLAGASLEVGKLVEMGLLGLGYIFLRALGLIVGAYAGGGVTGAGAQTRRWMGLAIMPQAGVALGMALVAGNALPGLRESVLPLVVGSTVVFELVGPVLTRWALIQSGEAKSRRGQTSEGSIPEGWAGRHGEGRSLKGFLAGIGFLVRGFDLIRRPGWRRYAVAPVVVSLLVFALVAGLLAWGFEAWMAILLPQGWGWLEWLLWPLFAMLLALIGVFAFVHLANLVGAPFNDLLAERVREWRRGESLPKAGWRQLLEEGPRAVANALQALAYGLFWAVPLLLLSLIPGVNLIAPLLWLVFNAWMLAIEYADYPLGGRGMSFREQRTLLARQRGRALGFGLATLVVTTIPVVNLAAMPAAVVGATLMLDDSK